MKRARLAIALALVVLATTAPIAAASSHTGLGVGSIHTTDSDFNTAAELTNITVEGSGSGASAVLAGAPGTTATREPDDDSVTGDSTPRGIIVNPNTAMAGVEIEVSQMVGTGSAAPTEAEVYDSSDTLVTSKSGTFEPGDVITLEAQLQAGSDYHIVLDGSSYTSGRHLDPSFPYTSSDIDIVDGAAGTVSNSRPWNIRSVTALSGMPESGRYVGATHSVENASQAFINVSLTDAHADYRIEFGGGPWSVADSGTLSSTGNHTIDISGHPGETQWRTNVTLVNETHAETTAQIHDEGIQFVAHAPTTSDPSPTGSADLTDDQATLSAQINDTDFPLAQSDSLTATWYMNGSQVGQTTGITSNGTYSTTVGGLSGGEHTWNVTVTDDYGLESVSGPHSITTPDTLFIFYEDSPEQLVTHSGTVEVSLYGDDDTIATRETDDGTVDLTDLDPNQEYVVSADVSGTHPRRVIITSLYEQQEIYLLNETETTVDVTYELDDRTGEFQPSDTRMLLERPITKDFDSDGNDETRYQTIIGDTFGAVNELPATIVPDQRYRIVVENAEGDRRDLGTHTVSSSGMQTIPIGEISVTGATDAGTAFSAGMIQNASDRYIQLTYVDQQDATTQLNVSVVRDDGTVFLPNQTIAGPLGTYQRTIAVPASEADDQTYFVRYWAERDGSEPDVRGERVVGGVPAIAGSLGVDPQILEWGGWILIVGSMGFTVIYDDRLAALTGVALGTGLTWLGVVAIPAVGLGIAGAIAVMYLVGREVLNR